MSRLSLLALIGACSAPAHAPAAPEPVTRYTLQPVMDRGNEGLHSAWHTTTRIEGSLELRGNHVALRLDAASSQDPVFCPAPMRDNSTMQACAPESAKSIATSKNQLLAGIAHWSGDTLTSTLEGPGRHAELRCTKNRFGLACALDDGKADLVFASSATLRFELPPTKLDDGQVVSGRLEITGTTAKVHAEIEGATAVDRTGTLSRAPAGLVIDTGPPTAHMGFICTEAATGLACQIGIDHEVFDRPSTWGPVAFVDTHH